MGGKVIPSGNLVGSAVPNRKDIKEQNQGLEEGRGNDMAVC
jgi:hypothetical protein